MLVKNKILNFQHLKDVIHAVALDQNRVIVRAHVPCVADTVKFVLARDFLQSNKHALNVLALANKLLIHAQVVEDKAKSKLIKDFL